MERRRAQNSGVDIAVKENQIGFRVFGRVLRKAHQQRAGTPQYSKNHGPQFHSLVPVSASSDKRILFSPSSLPLQSNHSCNVCAPPPEPPPPIAIASLPNDNGTLASVEARCTCDPLPRCASTARITWRIRALASNSPAGRFPMAMTSALNL